MTQMIHNALTIDLEDWYHAPISTCRRLDKWESYDSRVEANTEKLLEIFSEAGVRVTFFVLGYIAEHYSQLVRKIANLGHEIALHSYHHQQVHTLKPGQFRNDIDRSREAVQIASGKNVTGYRAPMFSINSSNLWALDILYKKGFLYDSSIFPVRNGYYGIPDSPRFPYYPLENKQFVEFPLATVRIMGTNWPIGGGLYVRTFPYAIVRAGIRKLNQLGKPAVIYFHPWEIDLNQHFTKLTLRERITHYYGRSSLESKLIKMLTEFKFVPLSKLLDHSTPDRQVN